MLTGDSPSVGIRQSIRMDVHMTIEREHKVLRHTVFCVVENVISFFYCLADILHPFVEKQTFNPIVYAA